MNGFSRGNFLTHFASILMSSPTSSAAHDPADLPMDMSVDNASAIAASTSASDLKLLKKAQAGDRAAYGQIVRTYQDRLFNGVLRMVGNREDARELTQEAFTRGLEKISSFRGESAPYTWLFRIAVNLAISQLRRPQRNRTLSLDGSAGSANGKFGGEDQAAGLLARVSQSRQAETPAGALEKKELHQQVLDALGRLEAEYRAILVMRDVEGFDYQQMADVLDLPLGTLKSRLFRARLALREELKWYMNA